MIAWTSAAWTNSADGPNWRISSEASDGEMIAPTQ